MRILAAALVAVILCCTNALAQSRDSFVLDPSAPPPHRDAAVNQAAPQDPSFAGAREPAVGAPSAEEKGWRPLYLLSGPAAIFKGVGASLWCIGEMSATLYSDVDSVGEGFTATFLWGPAVVADSVFSTLAYALVGLAHTVTFGFLVGDPPRKIEDIPAPIYCVISDHSKN